ncbi:hypothetical protein [Actinomadura rudentiformis]|uniref:Uncharacterized protein n=1 Tax=Actinomadura rudentiformis TaxID=359158 RepID=A0A6H9Y8P1_9ACTN|nr:hypothetical protein [Actinomadura rudentiformis]KAB2341306.1 hypothetical protein F8566_42055 [Actinomadura rudentiformis]
MVIGKLGIGAVAGMAVLGLLIYHSLPPTHFLSTRATDEIQSAGRLVTTVSTTNAAGSPVRESKYLVLEVESASPGEAVDNMVRALESRLGGSEA